MITQHGAVAPTYWATATSSVRPMLRDRCLSVLFVCPICNVGVFWPNGWMDQPHQVAS